MKSRRLTVIEPGNEGSIELCKCDGSLQSVSQCRASTKIVFEIMEPGIADNLLLDEEEVAGKIVGTIADLMSEKMICAAKGFEMLARSVPKGDHEYSYETDE